MNYFDEYVKNYDMNIPEISYKYYHSYRVMDNMCLLAKNMSLPEKDIKLAKCIGLLHDIARFEQFKQFKSFNDFNLDHGTYGEHILRENNVLSNYQIDKEDYEVVYKAIRNHNKFEIEKNLNNRELLFSKMIRDADKLDILYALSDNKLKSIVREDDSEISKKISSDFFNNKLCKKEKKFTTNDNIVILMGFIYDINFNFTLYLIKNNNYYNKIYSRLKHKDIFKPYIEHINKYLNERVD